MATGVTKRVIVAAGETTFGSDTWGGTWGGFGGTLANSWGRTWFMATLSQEDGTLTANITKRIQGAVT